MVPVVTYLMPDGIPAGSAPSGDTAPSSSGGTSVPSPSGQPSSAQSGTPSFYSYKFDDGKEQSFSTKNDLDTFFRGGVLRHSDYTKKTQELANERKAFETERKQMQDQVNRVMELQSKWEGIEKFMATRPELARELIAKYKGTQPVQPQADEKLRKEFEDLKKSIEEREKRSSDEERRKQIYAAMKGRYADFDESGIDKALSAMVESAPGDEMATLIELIHFANKGRSIPAEMEKRMAEELKRKQTLRPPLPPSNAGAGAGIKKFKSLEEAAEAAKIAAGV